MAVFEETPIISITANGVATYFPREFTILEAGDLVVQGTVSNITTVYELGVDYEISGVGASSGGVTFFAAPAFGTVVTQYRDISINRLTDYQDNGDLLADTVNRDFDRIVLMLQDIFNGGKVVPTCLRVPNGETVIALPASASRAGYFLGFDGSGQPTLLSATEGTAAALAADLVSSSDPLKGAALSGFGLDLPYADGTVGQAIHQMLGTQEYTLYVATTGSDSNDGSAGFPFATLQKAFDALMALGTVGGTRRISIGAGTYSSASARASRIGPANESETTDPDTDPYASNGVMSVNYIVIEGPDVGYDPQGDPDPVPTAIFEGGGAAAVGIQIEGPVKVLIKNLKFQNYDGSTSSGGIIGDGSMIRCENVHGDGNYYDISNSRGRLEVKGGILNAASGAAIRSIFHNKHEIGNQQAGATGEGPFITNAAIGVYAQEGATGHADYVTFTSCTDGIFATVNSRVNYTGSSFTSCSRGVRSLQAYVFASTATFASCTENKVIQMHGIDGPRDNYANGGLATDYLNSANTLTGSTASTPILSKTLAAGDFAPNVTSIRKPQHIEFEAFGSQSGTAGTKQHKLRLGSTVLAVITNASSDAGDWRVRGSIYFLDSNVQAGYIEYATHLSSIRVNVDTGTEDLLASGGTLTYEQQLGSASDSVVTQAAHMKTWG